MFSLAGKAAVVTGGSSGIGRAVARRFAAAGARVLVADRRPAPDGFDFHLADVSRESEVADLLDLARRKYGRLDVLVSNAGIQPLGVGFAGLTEELLERTLAVNVHSVAFGLKHAARVLADGGRVINTASFVGLIGVPGGAAYAHLEGRGDPSDPPGSDRAGAAPHHRERGQPRHDPHAGGDGDPG